MGSSWWIGVLYALAGLLTVVLPVGLLEYQDLKRKKSLVCPETGDTARVEVDARKGAIGVALGVPRLRVTTCSRWPQRASCDQACREQVRGPGLFFAA
jgi:hypothetical protein